MVANPVNDDLTILVNILAKHTTGWLKSRYISQQAISACGKHWDRRYVAELAEESQGAVISSGSGYMLQRAATDKEILAAYGTCMRKGLGSCERANQIIASARRSGRLIPEDRVAAERAAIEKQFAEAKGSTSATASPPTSKPLPSGPAVQAEMF